MTPRRRKPCFQCGTPTYKAACPTCQTPPATYQDRQRRKAFIEHWINTYGPVCPGYQRDLHHVPPHTLQADHINPRSTHGEHTQLQALCKSCNSAKQDGWTYDHRPQY